MNGSILLRGGNRPMDVITGNMRVANCSRSYIDDIISNLEIDSENPPADYLLYIPNYLVSYNRAFTLTLNHEIAHVRLGHVEDRTSMEVSLEEELEADKFVMDSIGPETVIEGLVELEKFYKKYNIQPRHDIDTRIDNILILSGLSNV